MLINFSFKNFMSFADDTNFSMLSQKENVHENHLIDIKINNTAPLVPIVGVFGPNAGGKTAFVQALHFMQHIILNGTPDENAKIPTRPFKLHAEEQPSYLEIEFRANDKSVYKYSFNLTTIEVITERLEKYIHDGYKLIYNRTTKGVEINEELIDFDGDNAKEIITAFLPQTLRSNQLFLRHTILNARKEFLAVHEWFQDSLTLVYQDANFEILKEWLINDKDMNEYVNKFLVQYDTGIAKIGVVNTKNKETGDINKDETVIASIHKNENGEDVFFNFNISESDGTKKLLMLSSAFFFLQYGNNKVFIIDEIDRSLHAKVVKDLLVNFLENNRNHNQLVFTAHDVMLLDDELLRKDEIWFVEKDGQGKSEMFSLSDFSDIENTSKLKTEYLMGRLGAIPSIKR